MAGFLNALGWAAPVLQGGVNVQQDIQNQQQRNLSEAAFGKALDTLGPRYAWAQNWYKQAGHGAAHDIAAAIGSPFGKAIQDQQQTEAIGDIFNDPNRSDEDKLRDLTGITGEAGPYAGLLAAKIKAANKPGEASIPDMADALNRSADTPGMPNDYAAYLRNAAKSGNRVLMAEAVKGAESHVPEMLKPLEPKIRDIPSIFDPNSGLFLKQRQILDARTMEPIKTEITGVDFQGPQKVQLNQAAEALYFIPKGQESAERLQRRFAKAGLDGEQQHVWLNAQWQAYTAARKAEGLNPLNPESWQYQHYNTVDDGANDYFTLMGQLSQQMAAPMGILRAMRIWDKISNHIPEPADIPANNLHRLEKAQDRFGYELQRVGEAEKSLSSFNWIGRGLPGMPGAAPAAASMGAAPGSRTPKVKGGARLTGKDLDTAVSELMR